MAGEGSGISHQGVARDGGGAERADELFGDEDDEHELHTTRADGKETVETTEKNDKELLGHMRIAVDPFAPPEKRQRHFGALAARAAEHGIPARYDMQTTSEDRPMHVFSAVRENTAAAGGGGGGPGPRSLARRGSSPRRRRRRCSPDDLRAGGGGVGEVRRASGEPDGRGVPAGLAAPHGGGHEEDARGRGRQGRAARGALPTARNVVKRLDGTTEGAKKPRAERLEKDALENALMGLFERRNLWTFKQLVEETKQPAVWLKEVLSELAVLNRRGPNTGMWTLKDMYKRRGAADAK